MRHFIIILRQEMYFKFSTTKKLQFKGFPLQLNYASPETLFTKKKNAKIMLNNARGINFVKICP